MALTPISNSVEFVQDSVPTTAADGDSWLDTSLSPPRLKVFDGGLGGFIEPRSIQNLDVPVSTAGADLRFIGGFELSLALFTGTRLDVSGAGTNPGGVTFSADGAAMFVINGGSVFQYSLSNAFDVSTASFTGTSFDVSTEENSARGVTFSTDGTTMFVIGDASNSVFQYSLSPGFDLSTASFTGTSFDVSTEETAPRDVEFNDDGTAMYVIGDSSNSVFQYSLSNAFDVSTASFTGTSFDVSPQTNFSTGIAFSTDGTTMFISGGGNSNSPFQYALSTGFSLSTASFSGTSFDVSEETVFATDVEFSDDGTVMYVTSSGNSDSVLQYAVGDVGPK